MRILILVNAPPESSDSRWSDVSISDRAVEEVADSVQKALTDLGHTSSVFPVGNHPDKLLQKLKRWSPDVAFNLCEVLNGESRLEPVIPYLLSWLKIPFTGNSPDVLGWAVDKIHTKRLLRDAGFPTPDFSALCSPDDLKTWKTFPAILKPASEDASLGIDNQSVVSSAKAAKERFLFLQKAFGTPIIIESFIEGREINVALLETENGTKTGLNEIDFSRVASDKPRIVTYEAKWVESSPDFQATPVTVGVQLSRTLDSRIRSLAQNVFRTFALKGYARIDCRVDSRENPFILEINPNPDFSTTGGFARSLPEMGLTYSQAVQIMLNVALLHHQRGKP